MRMWACTDCDFRTEQPDGVSAVAHECPSRLIPGKTTSKALKLFSVPKVNIRAAIVAASTAQFPREACGFILSDGNLVVAENASESPEDSFRIDQATAELWWPTGKVSGVWHSHCFDAATPSMEDELLAQPKLECWIYSVMDEELGIYKPDKQGTLQLIAMEDLSS